MNAAARNHAPIDPAFADLGENLTVDAPQEPEHCFSFVLVLMLGATLASDVVGGHRFGSNGAFHDERLYRLVE